MKHLHVKNGKCLICGHYGSDCTGTRRGWTQSAMERQQKIARIAAMRKEADVLENQLNPMPSEDELAYMRSDPVRQHCSRRGGAHS